MIVGVIEFTSKYRYGLTSRGAPIYLFRPYDDALPDYIVGSTERDMSRNQIALVDAVDATHQTKPRANLVKLFGPVGDIGAETAALIQHYCPVTNKTKALPTVNDNDDQENREPIDAEHGWITFHIDPPGCRDIDDAIGYHRASNTWAITIADVAAAVPADSATDIAARAIGSTFYSLEGSVVRPMLPPAISEDTASLLPGQRRRGLTLFIQPNNERFGLSCITVTHSFTYDSFFGSPLATELNEHRDPHVWIEELMIRYNKAAATALKKASVGLLRVQPPADAEKVAAWLAIDPALANEAASYEPAHPHMQQTHASIGDLYCHASSPLRRYADLVNQRALKALLQNVTAPTEAALAAHLNERIRATRRWARDLTFLTHVTPGRVHEIDVIWASESHVWVPVWRRLIRLRHDETRAAGYCGKIRIFCDPTRRSWKQRVLTAAYDSKSSPPLHLHPQPKA